MLLPQYSRLFRYRTREAGTPWWDTLGHTDPAVVSLSSRSSELSVLLTNLSPVQLWPAVCGALAVIQLRALREHCPWLLTAPEKTNVFLCQVAAAAVAGVSLA